MSPYFLQPNGMPYQADEPSIPGLPRVQLVEVFGVSQKVVAVLTWWFLTLHLEIALVPVRHEC